MSYEDLIIDGSSVQSIDAVYEFLKQTFGLEKELHANNPDALWDILPGYIDRPVKLIWKDHDECKTKFGADFEVLIGVLNDIQDDDPRFTLALE